MAKKKTSSVPITPSTNFSSRKIRTAPLPKQATIPSKGTPKQTPKETSQETPKRTQKGTPKRIPKKGSKAKPIAYRKKIFQGEGMKFPGNKKKGTPSPRTIKFYYSRKVKGSPEREVSQGKAGR